MAYIRVRPSPQLEGSFIVTTVGHDGEVEDYFLQEIWDFYVRGVYASSLQPSNRKLLNKPCYMNLLLQYPVLGHQVVCKLEFPESECRFTLSGLPGLGHFVYESYGTSDDSLWPRITHPFFRSALIAPTPRIIIPVTQTIVGQCQRLNPSIVWGYRQLWVILASGWHKCVAREDAKLSDVFRLLCGDHRESKGWGLCKFGYQQDAERVFKRGKRYFWDDVCGEDITIRETDWDESFVFLRPCRRPRDGAGRDPEMTEGPAESSAPENMPSTSCYDSRYDTITPLAPCGRSPGGLQSTHRIVPNITPGI